MKIEHVAIWVINLESMRRFYITYFDVECGAKYENKAKGFTSYFLSFRSGARIELMHRADIAERARAAEECPGITHLAISVGSRAKVDDLTNTIRAGGFRVEGEPRTTGDGYYESVILDPEGNRIEITE